MVTSSEILWLINVIITRHIQIIRTSMKYFADRFIITEQIHCTNIVIFCAPKNYDIIRKDLRNTESVYYGRSSEDRIFGT